ncbi:MAG: hypothetical protein IT314_14030 [Anaerolineales bacterium]|nr:hypothetical protein [Anaerolineales bacterium]
MEQHSRSRRNHLAPFLEGPRPWLVLARNALPVIGVYLLGWSESFVIFQLWFDGVTALGAMLAFHMRGFVRNDTQSFDVPPGIPKGARVWVLIFAWLVFLLLLGTPYWFTFFFFGSMVFVSDFWLNLFRDFGLVIALLFVLASNIIEEYQRGYRKMSDKEIRLEFNWEFSMHLARITALILATFFLRLGLIAILALALSYIEIYPMRTLRFLGGDKTLETENESRSID